MLGHLHAAGRGCTSQSRCPWPVRSLSAGTTVCICQTCLSAAGQGPACIAAGRLPFEKLSSCLQIFLIAVKSFSSHAASTPSEQPLQPQRLTRAALTAASEQDMTSEQVAKAPAVSGQQVHHLRAQGGVRCAAVQANLPTMSLPVYSHCIFTCRKPVRSLSKSNFQQGE